MLETNNAILEKMAQSRNNETEVVQSKHIVTV